MNPHLKTDKKDGMMRRSKLRRRSYATLIPLLLSLFSAQAASACMFYAPLDPADYALPDVVFEGEVVAIHPETKLVPSRRKISPEDKPGEISEVVGMDITFNVLKIIRGDIEFGEVRVGWHRRGTHGYYPETLPVFEQRWGTLVRVGLTTPDVFKQYCSEEHVPHVPAKSSGEHDGRQNKIKTVCTRDASGFHAKDASTKTYVFSAGCFDEPYMIPVLSNADGHYSK